MYLTSNFVRICFTKNCSQPKIYLKTALFQNSVIAFSMVFNNVRHSSRRRGPTIDPQEAKCDCVGPPDEDSNIRLYKYYVPNNETKLEALFRLKKEETQEWHRLFWATQNTKFKKEKEIFIKNKLLQKYGDQPEEIKNRYLSAEEMAEFYKSFLDKSYEVHKSYNTEWYKRNFEIIWLSLKVIVQRALKKLPVVKKLS